MLYVGLHKNLIKALSYLIIPLSVASCNSEKQSMSDEMASLHPAPKIVALNTQEGYSINPVTGDSIEPIINSLGDTVKTGVPVPAIGKVIDPDSVAKPKVIPTGEPKVVSIHQNVHKIPEDLTVIPINKSSLKTFSTKVDTVTISVSIPARGKVVPCRQPQPVKAFPPLMKDNANINIKYLDVDQGMNSSGIPSMLEDSHGNIWFCSLSRGVSMYNGETFTHFTKNEGLCNNSARSILEDSRGNIWVGTLSGGVSMYDGETFTHFTQNEGLNNNFVWSILEDSHSNIWFGTEGGVSMYNGETFTHFTQKEGLSNNTVLSILEDSHGNFWFGTDGGGVSIYNGKTFTHFTQNEGLSDNVVYSMLEDSHGIIWLGTNDGVRMYNGETITHFTQNEGLSDTRVRSILEDRSGNLWFGTNGGVNMYNGETFTHFTQNEGLSDKMVLSILEDGHGNLWFGTECGGISIYYGETFTHFTQKDGLSDNVVYSIVEDSHGNIWVGTYLEGVNVYDGETFTHFTQNEGLSDNTVWSILEDSQRNLWFGTQSGGVSMYNRKTFTHFTQNEGLSDNFIWSILEDSHGNLWFGTDGGGLSMYNGKTFTHFTEKEGLCDNHIRSILEDSQGNLWFGTLYGGVSMYDGETFTHFTEKEGLSNNNVRSILEDSRGNLWFGTGEAGVNMFNGKTFTHFTQNEGLSDNWVTSILEDSYNNIWLGTSMGLNRIVFEPENISSTKKGLSTYNPVIHSYSQLDGLKGISFVDGNSVLLDSKKRIWWGTNKCLTMLDINNLKIPVEPPVMQLNRIDINGQFVDYRHLDESDGMKMEFDSVARFYNYPLNLELSHSLNNLTFHFTAIDWSASQKLKYRYLMEGLDDKWNAPTAEAYVEYRNMPHGRYTFKVHAIGAAQKWSNPIEYTFTISPPFWLTWWAYMIYGFILLLLMRWYRGFLIKREKISADLRVKEVEINKMQELDHMKSRFFANISHEFRTPLTLIQGPIEELRKQFQGKPEGSLQLFQTVKRNTKRLQDLISQLLDISKLETGNVNLQVSMGDLVEFVKAIVLSFLSLAEYKKIKYEYDLPQEGWMVHFDPDKIEKILTNLISNAFKFTTDGGNIWVGIQFLDASRHDSLGNVEIKVSDTGKGIPEEMLDKIFDRFYQVCDPDTREAEGTGLGLALTKELIDLYRGNIIVESEPGKGSTFTVNLPVSAAQFREEEILTQPPDEVIKTEPVAPVHEHEDYKESEIIESQIPDTTKDKPTILIVEDNADLRKYISRNLESNYSIIFAENGKIGLDKAYENIPDLVISDVMMPEMDGMEMCKRLKTDERTDHIPVIMLTARADRYSKLEGLETGADDYLIKPFDTEELKVRVKNMLEQRRKLREKFRMEFLSDATGMGLPPKDQFINRLLDIFDQYISDPEFKITQLSGELNLSQSQVRRKVMAITGYTPNELFRNHRLKKAAVLFRSGHTHVAQVMHHVGFNSQSYFTRCFGELYEMPPSQFIATYKK